MVLTLPKYTQYQLSNLVEMKLHSKYMTLRDASKLFSVDEEKLQEILGKKVRYKLDHYEIVSKITGLSMDELLSDEIIQPISFRSEHTAKDSNIINEIEIVSNFFKEVALLKKLNGEIGAKEWLYE